MHFVTFSKVVNPNGVICKPNICQLIFRDFPKMNMCKNLKILEAPQKAASLSLQSLRWFQCKFYCIYARQKILLKNDFIFKITSYISHGGLTFPPYWLKIPQVNSMCDYLIFRFF